MTKTPLSFCVTVEPALPSKYFKKQSYTREYEMYHASHRTGECKPNLAASCNFLIHNTISTAVLDFFFIFAAYQTSKTLMKTIVKILLLTRCWFNHFVQDINGNFSLKFEFPIKQKVWVPLVLLIHKLVTAHLFWLQARAISRKAFRIILTRDSTPNI